MDEGHKLKLTMDLMDKLGTGLISCKEDANLYYDSSELAFLYVFIGAYFDAKAGIG